MDLQEKIERFAANYGPKEPSRFNDFVFELREVMNDYARAAIVHGDVPEEGVPHK